METITFYLDSEENEQKFLIFIDGFNLSTGPRRKEEQTSSSLGTVGVTNFFFCPLKKVNAHLAVDYTDEKEGLILELKLCSLLSSLG